MKKLVLMLAVAFSMTMFSCGNTAEKAADAAEAAQTTVEETADAAEAAQTTVEETVEAAEAAVPVEVVEGDSVVAEGEVAVAEGEVVAPEEAPAQ